MDHERQGEERIAEQEANDARRKIVYIALTALLLCGIGYYVWGHMPTQEKTAMPAETPSVGVIDMRKVLEAHRAYAEVERLEGERRELVKALERLLSIRRAVSAPPLAKEPFQMAEEQKERQQLRIEQAELKKARGEAMDRWVKEREPLFMEKRKDIEALYQNRIVNIEMKLDNAKPMGLSEEEQARLYQELEGLRAERGSKIRAVFEEYLAERDAYMQSLILKDASAAVGDAAAVRAKAMERKDAAETRNTENMQEEMKDVELAALIRQKKAALAAKLDEIKIMEEHIRREIESRAEKLAIAHHLDIVYAGNTVPYLTGLSGEEDEDVQPTWLPQGSQVMDLTDEIIKELSE